MTDSDGSMTGTGTRRGVIVVGSVTADVTTFTQRLPRPGETILGDDFTMVLGGKGANQAVAAARAGAPSWFVGCVGSDLFHSFIVEGLASDGVNLDYLRTVEAGTGIAHIRVDASGENDIVVVPRANSLVSLEQVNLAIDGVGPQSTVMLVQLEIPVEIAVHAMRTAHTAGLTVILDPAPASALPDDIWPHVNIVTPNETEAGIITGIAVVDRASAAAAGQWFVDRGTGIALVTLASGGAMLVTEQGSQHYAALDVAVVDTTAAGDAFAGYLGAAISNGDALDVAIERAMAAGALAVTSKGASPSLPHLGDVEAFLDAARR